MGSMPFLRAQIARRMPTPINFREREALELDGFPEYITEVTPEQFKKIDDLATQIVKSNDTNDPIFEFRVEGFADVARRIGDRKERKWFEDNISNERAQNGFDLLIEALKRKGDDALAQKIKKGSKAFGLGSQRLKVPNASTEAQFRRNRRVVFIVRQVTFIPPPPEPPPPPSSVVEDRFSVQLLRAAIVTVTVSPGVESVTVAVSLNCVDRIDKKAAVFNVFATGLGIGGGPTPGGISFTRQGQPVPFKTFRLLGRLARGVPPISLESFVGSVTVFIDVSGGMGPLTEGGTLSFSFNGLESNGVNTQPGVIRVPGGNSVMTPGLSAPTVVHGRMQMVGKPVDN